MNAVEAAGVAEDAVEALRAVSIPAYAVLEDCDGAGEYVPYVAITTEAAHELAHQCEVEGA